MSGRASGAKRLDLERATDMLQAALAAVSVSAALHRVSKHIPSCQLLLAFLMMHWACKLKQGGGGATCSL